MGYSVLEFKNDPIEGLLLIAAGEARKGGAFIARIVDTDTIYRYKREFLGRKENKDGIVYIKVKVSELQEGDLLDIRCGGSWKNDYRGFYVYENGELKSVKEEELRERLARKINRGGNI